MNSHFNAGHRSNLYGGSHTLTSNLPPDARRGK
jgi:hypothetical protein